MQMDEAARLREKWGDKPCSHPKIMKEYYLGSQTGDKVCTTCGAVIDEDEKLGLDNTHSSQKNQ
jgi:transcription initiation factor TFIIIB Brf1 subunit/transcription initiation factor TFIIB